MTSHSIKKNNEKLTLSIDKEVIKEYKKWCGDEGLVISKQVENFMKEKLNNKHIKK